MTTSIYFAIRSQKQKVNCEN